MVCQSIHCGRCVKLPYTLSGVCSENVPYYGYIICLNVVTPKFKEIGFCNDFRICPNITQILFSSKYVRSPPFQNWLRINPRMFSVHEYKQYVLGGKANLLSSKYLPKIWLPILFAHI
jgi:hypothetical protein